MITVKQEIEVHGIDGNDLTEANQVMEIRSHYSVGNKGYIDIVVGSHSYTVYGQDVIVAADNATNVG